MVKRLYTDINADKDYAFERLYQWSSPDRYWEPKGRAWYVLYSLFFVIIITLVALMGEYLLILAIIAFVFLWFVQASLPPEIIDHTVTNIGIKTYGKLYKWKDFKHFWFSSKNGLKLLNLVIEPAPEKQISPKTITLLLNDDDEDILLFKILVKNIDYGDRDEISFNIFTQLIHGRYIELTYYLPDEVDVDYIDVQDKKPTTKVNESDTKHKSLKSKKDKK